MYIDAIELYRVKMPLTYPFRTAFGDHTEIESVLVKLIGEDTYGWGETAPWAAPTYSPEWAGGVFILLRDWLGPLLLGKNITSGTQLQEKLSPIKGNHFAKAGLDLAWWDLHARQLDKPLWQVIGGQTDVVEVGADFGVMESIDRLLEAVDDAVQAGFKRIKLKYRPGWELDMVAAVCKTFPNTTFHVDCNSAYRLDDAEMFKMLDDYGLAMIEQPLAYDDLIDHAKLQRLLHTPICLDESITSVTKAAQSIELQACQWVNIKPGRVGGLTNAIAIHDLCQEAKVPVWIGGMLESAVGAAHCIALATLPNVKYPSDIFPSSRFYKEDLAEPEITLTAPSQVRATSAPGIGHEPNLTRLQALQVDSVTLS